MKRTVSSAMLALLLISMVAVMSSFRAAWGFPTIHIRADGSVDPPAAPIQRDGDIYTLTNSIIVFFDGIAIERDDMTLDGGGYAIYGTNAPNSTGIHLVARRNVNITNVRVDGFESGILLENSTNNNIFGNRATNNQYGIDCWGYSDSNSILGNNIIASTLAAVWIVGCSNIHVFGNDIMGSGLCGIKLERSSLTTVYHNNFINNTQQVLTYDASSIWDSGYPSGGNYWSDHNGTDSNGDGIGDTPYTIDESNVDRYPWISPYGPPPAPPTYYALTIDSAGGGTTQPTPGTHAYESGTFASVTALPNAPYVLDHWVLDGSAAGSANPKTVAMDGNHTLEAVFAQTTFQLTVLLTTGGTTDPPSGNYIEIAGSTVQVQAIPDANYTLDHWELDGGDVGSDNLYSLLMSTNHMLRALFTSNVGVHDVAVTNATPQRVLVRHDSVVNLNAAVANHGSYAESFDLTLTVNATHVATQTMTLDAGSLTMVTLHWNTTGFAAGNYTLTTYAEPVPNETRTKDNTRQCWIIISVLGDLTGPDSYPDGRVDMRDVSMVARLFGVNYPNPKYNKDCDINGDGRIDMKDVAAVAKNFGEHM